MHSRSPIARPFTVMLASLMLVLSYSVATAQETSYKASFQQNKESIAVNVLVGQSRVINFDRPVGRFSAVEDRQDAEDAQGHDHADDHDPDDDPGRAAGWACAHG